MSERSAATIRVATYNVHGCVGTDGRRSESRIAQVIAELAVDIVGLQELDLRRPRSESLDQAGAIAAELGWHRHFQVAMERGEEHYGHAILSRYPLTLQRAQCLPGVAPFFCRETRAAVAIEVMMDFGPVHVINTHLGLGRRERKLQAELLTSADWLAASTGGAPLILLGDFNSLPGSKPHRLLSRHLHDVRQLVKSSRKLRTFPTALPVLAVDHIFVNAALQPLRVAVHRTAVARVASDHFPLLAELLFRQTESGGKG
jgi:endonuclease/exonuclease/phosphatase family metal-dependent hydrolase